MNKINENLIIEHTENLLSTLKSGDITKDQLLEEYTTLLQSYKDLNEKYTDIQKSENTYISRNDDLQNLTKKKTFENASSIIELKEKYNDDINLYKTTIQNLKEEINNNNTKILKLSKELYNSKKELEFLKNTNIELESQVKNLEEFNIPFETILQNEINNARNNDESLVLAITGIYNFANIRDKIKEFTTLNNFILGIFKYLVNNLRKEDTVKFIEVEMFYILLPNTDSNKATEILEKFSIEKDINHNNISLSSGFTTLKKDDTVDSIIERASYAYNESIKDTRHSLIVRR